MANIDRIVKVSISLRTAGVTQASFSDLLLFGQFQRPTGAGSTDVVFIITDPQELLDDYGCQATDPIYRAALVFFSQIPHPPRLFIGMDANAAQVENDLTAIIDQNSDWYAVCDAEHDDTRALAIGEWTEAQEKLFITVLSAIDNASNAATDTTSVAYQLMQQQLFRTAWWYDPDADNFPDVAIAAKSFTKYPGQETWANQRLSNVAFNYLNETTAQNIFDKNGNTFEPFRNIAITQNGKVAGGEWIDVIRFRDWLCEEIKTRVFLQMVDNRIPYTDPGIAIIRTRVTQALDFGVARGGIAPPEVDVDGNYVPSYTVDVPLSTTVSVNDKANRILRDVYFTARLAGAIHVVEIQGTLTYENLPVAASSSAVNVAMAESRSRRFEREVTAE
jgi:uncharacterized protein DUF3383